MSTLRDAAKALVESEQSYGRQCGEARCIWCDANPADEAHADGCEFGALVRALESETREARTPVDAAGVARLLDAIDTAEALTTKTNAEIGRLLLDHVWQHMDLNSAAELVMSEAISRLAPDLEGEAPPPANTENDR